MARFRMEQELPSTLVTRELVKSLEALISKQIDALASKEDNQGDLRAAKKVFVSDALGTETIQSIDDFGPSKFPDTTKQVGIYFSAPWGTSLKGLEIDIQFHNIRSLCRVKVACDGSNARELAHGITKSVLECIAPHETGNGWLHPKPFLSGVLFALASGSLWFSAMALGAKSIPWALAFAVLFVLLITYQWVLPTLRPYVAFDSRASDIRGSWSDWATKGILGFILFGTVLALARDHILKLFGTG
jgi:hypothetical protein